MTASTPVPIRNVYALLAYAFDFLDIANPQIVGSIEADTPVHLLARLLDDGLRRPLRRGAFRSYLEQNDDLQRLKGSFDITQTVARALKPRGRVYCRFDELSYDVPENQAIKAAARLVLSTTRLPDLLRRTLKNSLALMSDVTDLPLDDRLLRSVKPPRGHRLYGPLLDICKLIK